MSHPIPIDPVDELPPGKRKIVFVNGRSIVIFNIEGTVYAIDNSCPHNGASLASGQLDGYLLQCPAHGLRFDLTTGCMHGAGSLCLTTFPVRAADSGVVAEVDFQLPKI
ncbi:Naphthalene 1,2-dioxygenase/salicylate 5-hydroxylase systems, ferredoxin component [Paraburkholderia domus]|jgi:Ferredoxin subunits of nitrite reductase and ring-hydroxylating dioxygenases|uniref:Naphthalene 1,2-dioxygenase/salicylate 5-hydroxylase systems, ferredoxin component n=1 Tax=Paraburkholderia domus TaxID=2793075 RepID=A0A9N8N4R3_9BURK|nr:Rieske (2Fe-2S) protein [Paraburkholderia domus]MBK5053081.1 Rieske (2Fe-2S) protein [Burkholderia sp. R-70006]MBK5065127.1 Rieske (2Fe-2S) protein [Burkholderia sp. R-70199]MBK5090302.1 Rieske (2Fe-2S) protein [Burkholderia sp. R-69927]MBK5124709.1 Rieske (2Fe-2S) protein [Burkholderia sp. R-69980]MBK5168959.1 Rieske (2Fe-2S) protein [Burkholderia sp. R-70211]MBK5184164.1 Rieske (2Fe-2S) protein [Burkholderia sp. R-69749]MCI0150645.1 Rieske 2Fe-2S domain-containing protein [Paraburkholde